MLKKLASGIAVALFATWISRQALHAQDLAAPRRSDGIYSITVAGQTLRIDPVNGGRITSLILKDEDFLTDSTVNNFNWGSTFWFSPQSDWNWPPSAEIDHKPYSANVEGNALVMKSRKDPKTGLTVTKRIRGNVAKVAFEVSYEVRNESNQVQKVAPWEVTRVKTGGMAFFPSGKDQPRGGLLPSSFTGNGVFWYVYQKAKLPVKGDRQIYADGSEGWLAQLNGNRILVKKFPDISLEETAPKEGEVELFASEISATGSGYVEIEHQGAWRSLPPGKSFTWTTVWFLRELPPVIDASPGSGSLADYVRKIVK